jgi:hypothetical protein
MFRVGQGGVEDLDDLGRTKLAWVILDVHPTPERAGFIAVYTEHAHQFALDRLAEDGLAIQYRVPHLDGARLVVHHLPTCHQISILAVTNHTALIAGGDRRGYREPRRYAHAEPR